MWSVLVGPIADLVKTVVNKIWGDKISEAEKAQLETAIKTAVMDYDWKGVEKEYADRDSARQLAKADVDKGNWFTNILAATIRPTFGFIVIGAFVYSFVAPYIPGAPEITINAIQQEIILTVIYFYFGGRTVEKGMATWKEIKKK